MWQLAPVERSSCSDGPSHPRLQRSSSRFVSGSMYDRRMFRTSAWTALVVVCACGRFGFDDRTQTSDGNGNPGDDATTDTTQPVAPPDARTDAAPGGFYVGSHPTAIAVGDFNNDGKTDLAVTNGESSTVS